MNKPEFESQGQPAGSAEESRRFSVLAWLVLLGGLLLLWPCFIGISQLRIQNDLEHWLAESDDGLKQLLWYYGHFPPEDRVLLTWRGSSMSDPRVEAVTALLKADNPYVSGVLSPKDFVARMVERDVPEEVAIERLRGMLIGHGEDASPISLLVTMTPLGSERAALAVASIRQAAREVGVSDEDLALGGSAVARSQLDEQVAHAAWNPNITQWWMPQRSPLLMSVVVGLLLCVIFNRGVLLTGILIAASIYGVILSLAVIGLTGGHIDLVSTIIPALLFVLALSGGVHLVNYWRPAPGVSRATTIRNALRLAWKPCVLASVTTAIGLWSLASSPLIPVRTFGIYAGTGCLCILAAALVLMPALLYVVQPRRSRDSDLDNARWTRLGVWLARHSFSVSVITIGIMMVASVGLRYLRTETKIIRYFPDSSRIIQDYTFVEKELSGIVPMELIIRFQPEAVDNSHFAERLDRVTQIQGLIRQHPDVSGSLSLSDFRPAVRKPGENATTMQRIRYFKTADEFRRRMERGEYPGSQSFFQVVSADEEYATAGDELWRITAQVNILSDLNYASFIEQITTDADTSLKGLNGAAVMVTGHVPLFLRTQQAVLESLIVSFVITAAIISLILLVLLRSIPGAIAAMLPNVFPIAIVFGGFSWYGGVIDLGTMMTASIGLGIAVDGTLHVLSWFEAAIRAGKNHKEAAATALGHCGAALWQTAAMTAGGLAMLGFADLLLVSRFGWMMASMLIAAWVGDFVMLPALLAGPMGRALANRIRKPGLPHLEPKAAVEELEMASVAGE